MTSNLLDDFTSWLLKTRSSFHQVELQLPLYFGICCWNYAFAGLCMFWTEPKWSHCSRFPFRSFALFLILVQSPLSFGADYLHMSHDSYWHVADRLVATPALMLEGSKILAMIYHEIRRKVLICYSLALLFAVYCFLQSQEAQQRVDRNAFVFYHNLWHMYPIIASIIILFDFYCLGGWKQSARPLYSVEIHRLRRLEKRVD